VGARCCRVRSRGPWPSRQCVRTQYKFAHVLLKDRVCPLVIRTFSDRVSFRQTTRLFRVMQVLIKHLNALLVRGPAPANYAARSRFRRLTWQRRIRQACGIPTS